MLLSIDPGINNCGIAAIEHSAAFTVVETFNVNNARRFTEEEKLLEKTFGTRVVKVNFILAHVRRFLKNYPEIDHVAIEAPFYSALTPLAYGSLLEVISAIKYAILVPDSIPYSMAEPLLVKRAFFNVKIGRDMKKKDVVRQFMEKKVASGEILINVSVDTLTEHEIDAVAVGFTRMVSVLEAIKNEQALPDPIPLVLPLVKKK
jgi:Holliday junction resolvasome RuvABC endonuclease subunit